MHPAVRLTQDLVRVNSVNPPGSEQRCAEMLLDRLAQSGFETELRLLSPGRPNLIARLPGSGRAPALCFTGHLDTVPLGTEVWSHDPLGGELAEGRIWGRGTTDMKSGIAAFVVAAERYAHRPDRPGDILLLLTAAEETGCEGATIVAQELPGSARIGAIVVAEPTSNRVVHGHKGATWFKLRARGKSAHGSRPDLGVNAIYRLADAVEALRAYRFPETPHPLLGMPSLNVGTISGGQNINSVPDVASLTLDIRTVWPQSDGDLLRSIADAVGPDIEIDELLSVPRLATEIGNDWVKRMEGIAESVTGELQRPSAAAFFTDGPVLGRAAPSSPILLIGPGDPELAHQTDESCGIDAIEAACLIYSRIMDDWHTHAPATTSDNLMGELSPVRTYRTD